VHHRDVGATGSLDQPAAGCQRAAARGGIGQLGHRGQVADDAALELHRHDGATPGYKFGQVGHELNVAVGQTAGVRQLVLASGSSARASVLRDAGIDFVVDRPGVDERAHDDLLVAEGPSALALHLARLKLEAVAGRHPSSLVLAADQVGVLGEVGRMTMLVQQPTFDGAVEQLVAMSGTTHLLVNGLVLVDTATGREVTGTDVQTVTMRTYDRAAAEAYVHRFEPYESAGSYRLEDQEQMAPDERLLEGVAGEDPTGVLGLPLPLFRRMLAELDAG